jgi:hypothetical protein
MGKMTLRGNVSSSSFRDAVSFPRILSVTRVAKAAVGLMNKDAAYQ